MPALYSNSLTRSGLGASPVASSQRTYSVAGLSRRRAEHETSTSSNARVGVTGALLYADVNVTQALEGPAAAVDAAFARVAADPRHGAVTVLYRGRAEERSFPDWAVGLRTPLDLSEGEERECLQSVFDGVASGPTRAHRLLGSFRAPVA